MGQEQDLDVSTAAKVEAFVGDLYPTSKSKERTTDEIAICFKALLAMRKTHEIQYGAKQTRRWKKYNY